MFTSHHTHVHHHYYGVDAEVLRNILTLLQQIHGDNMSTQDAINRLKAEVVNLSSVNQAVVALITGLAQQIRDAADDPQEINAIADAVAAQAAQLGAAVSANTPAEEAAVLGTGEDEPEGADAVVAEGDPEEQD